MKKAFPLRKVVYGLVGLLILGSSLFFILLFSDATSFQRDSIFFVIKKEQRLADVRNQIQSDSSIVHYNLVFNIFAYGVEVLGYHIAPGKYQIKKGMSTFDIIRVIYGRKQYTIRLTIGKHRQWGDFIKFVKTQVPIDSAVFADKMLERADSDLVDTSLLLTYIIPDTYYLYWTTSTSDVVDKLYARYLQFWNENRLAKCKQQNLSPQQAYVIASLVEEETIHAEDKPLIASVYLNRYRKRMHLGSCPTVKYALRRFDLRRILYKHLKVESSFNTYRNIGLPPGPICIPSTKTIDAVLNAPDTAFLYFVADSNNSDRHLFSTTYKEHRRKARIYVNKIFRK